MDRIDNKLKLLRKQMKENNIDSYIITKNDPHQSENAKDHWHSVAFISGFTGSAGIVVITKDKAILWSDGRYSIQAVKELSGSEFVFYNTAEPETINYLKFAVNETPENGTIGFDGRTMSSMEVMKLLNSIGHKKIQINADVDFIGAIWENRPSISPEKIFEHSLKYAGVTREEKIAVVKEKMIPYGCSHYVISSLDDIAWLLNLRCNESDNLLVFESFMVLGDENVLFVPMEKIKDVLSTLEKSNVFIKPYEEIIHYIKNLPENSRILYAPDKTSFSIYQVISKKQGTFLDIDITTSLKAVKNSCEIENTKDIHIRDGAVVAKFIKRIKETAPQNEMTEYSAGNMLDEMRSKIDTFLCTSFSTICGYGPNGALNHYRASKMDSLTIKDDGFLLVDSGGNYLNGTTDITRTIALKNLTDEMKENYTLVLKCHIALATAEFIYGSTGSNLDAIARIPLWNEHKDFKHGTGHGIGYALNCHEGPHRISPLQNTTILEEGMMVSNEPGFYLEGHYGIRSENILIVRKSKKTSFGQFLCFENITFCPFDLDAINVKLLTEKEKQWLNAYHDEVYTKLSPYFEEDIEQLNWLKDATRAI